MFRRTILLGLFSVASAGAQDTREPGTWSSIEIGGNWICERDKGERIDPDGSDRRGAVTRVCNDWTELELKMRALGLAFTPEASPPPDPGPQAWIMAAVVGALADGASEAEVLLDSAAGYTVPIVYRSTCRQDLPDYTVVDQDPPAGATVMRGDTIRLTVALSAAVGSIICGG